MSTAFPRQGILAALWIPTDRRGRLMKRALAAHLGFLRGAGIKGVLALGSTGEFPRFSLDERKRLLATIVELAGPLPVIANISDINLRNAVELGQFARKLRLPGVALMSPGFYPLSQADLLEFFLRVAEAVQLPVMLYNFPEVTGTRISPETIAAFAERAPLVAIKQSGAEFAYHADLVELGRQKEFVVFSGSDTRLPEVLQHGAVGCVGGLANFIPEPMLAIHQAMSAGQGLAPAAAAAQMVAVGSALRRLRLPLNVAAGMAARGLDPGYPRMAVSAESTRLYQEAVAALGTHFRAWQLLAAAAEKNRAAPVRSRRKPG